MYIFEFEIYKKTNIDLEYGLILPVKYIYNMPTCFEFIVYYY